MVPKLTYFSANKTILTLVILQRTLRNTGNSKVVENIRAIHSSSALASFYKLLLLMEQKRKQLSHAEIWDDSALLQSWDDALTEYKVFNNPLDHALSLLRLNIALSWHTCAR